MLSAVALDFGGVTVLVASADTFTHELKSGIIENTKSQFNKLHSCDSAKDAICRDPD